MASAPASSSALAGLPILDPTREAAVIRRVTDSRARRRPAARARARSLLADRRHVAARAGGERRSGEGREAGAKVTPRSTAPPSSDSASLAARLPRISPREGWKSKRTIRTRRRSTTRLRTGWWRASSTRRLPRMRADVVVIATPVDAAVDVLRALARANHRATLITDVGSTKGRIVAEADALGLSDRFVGSHPMAGDHRSGWSAARQGLFSGARVYLCAPDRTPAELVARADDFWRALEAHPMRIDASAHDRTLAWTSHLPHVVSAALALALGEAGVGRDELGPGGRDITRFGRELARDVVGNRRRERDRHRRGACGRGTGGGKLQASVVARRRRRVAQQVCRGSRLVRRLARDAHPERRCRTPKAGSSGTSCRRPIPPPPNRSTPKSLPGRSGHQSCRIPTG